MIVGAPPRDRLHDECATVAIARRRVTLAGLVVGAAVLLFLLLAGSRPGAASAVVTCAKAPPESLEATSTPQALRRRYGIQPLLDAHYDGRGQTAVLLEFNWSVDIQALEQWEACLDVTGPPVTQKAIRGEPIPLPPPHCRKAPSKPACFGEAQGDAYSMVTGAPGLRRLYVIVSTQDERHALAGIVDQLRLGKLTDGRRPDVVSLSFGKCQPEWKKSEVENTEASLRRLAGGRHLVLQGRGRRWPVGVFEASQL